MNKRLILRTQKNHVLEILQNNDLAPAEFQWGETALERSITGTGAAVVSKLTHPASGAEFTFDVRGDRFWAIFSPAPEAPRAHEMAHNWGEMRHHVHIWALTLKRELDAPDLWAAVAQEKGLAAAATHEENTTFTEEESTRLESAIGEIRENLRTVVQMQDERAERVDRQFAYLQGAIRRMGRRDWLHTAIGVLFTVACSIGAEDAKNLFRFAWQQISNALDLAVTYGPQFLESF